MILLKCPVFTHLQFTLIHVIKGGRGPVLKRKKWRLFDGQLSSDVTDFDDNDQVDYLHCIGEMLFSA